jgi:hypothetical protein
VELPVVTAIDALRLAEAEGVVIRIDKGDLFLSAKRAPPVDLVRALRNEKAAIVDLLMRRDAEELRAIFDERAAIIEHDGGRNRAEAELLAYEHTLAHWMARHPASTSTGRCAWCGAHEADEGVLVPYGGGGTYAWLHYGCYPAWRARHERAAERALASLGIARPNAEGPAL